MISLERAVEHLGEESVRNASDSNFDGPWALAPEVDEVEVEAIVYHTRNEKKIRKKKPEQTYKGDKETEEMVRVSADWRIKNAEKE